MLNTKESYYPSNYTLTVIDTFGCKPLHAKRGSRKLQVAQSESKIPQFARKNKKTFDKEELLQQVREQKRRYQMVGYTRSVLGKSVSRPKMKIARSGTALLGRQRQISYSLTLKREMEQLVVMIQKQCSEIDQIKTSKKYNRILELSILREAYEEELEELRRKMRSYRHEIRERRRVRRQQRKRERQIKIMNQTVQTQIDAENMQITQQIQTICGQLKVAKAKQSKDRHERERLLREIYELQERTGVVYLVRQQQAVVEQQQMTRIPMGEEQISPLVEESWQQQSQESSESESLSGCESGGGRLNLSF